MIRNEFNCDLSFLDELLLFHGFLSINFTNFLWHSLTNSKLMRLELNSFVLFKDGNKFEFDLTCFKSPRNGYISDVLELMKSVEDMIWSICGKEELNSDLIWLCRYSIIKVDLSSSDESCLFECDLKIFKLSSWFGTPFEYELIRRCL